MTRHADGALRLAIPCASTQKRNVQPNDNASKIDFSLAVAIGVALGISSAVHAQVATTVEQAELAGLTPEKRAEVQSRMSQGGQKVQEILQTMLLNNIKAKYPANRIVAMDFGRGVAVVELPSGESRTVNFDTTTLAVKS